MKKRLGRPIVELSIGDTFARWTIIGGRIVKSSSGHYLCRCRCGVEKYVHASSLKRGKSVSCGCWNREATSARNYKHDQTNRSKPWTPEYIAWHGALGRHRGHINAKNYKKRGITMCQGWRDSFASFLADMGQRTSERHSIDRIDNNGGYWCGHCEECIQNKWGMNCRWASPVEQCRNTRNNVHIMDKNGTVRILVEWAEVLGVKWWTVNAMVRRGELVRVPKLKTD